MKLAIDSIGAGVYNDCDPTIAQLGLQFGQKN